MPHNPWLLDKALLGNDVMIEHADEELGLYAHLQPGSVLILAGERVVQSQSTHASGHTGHSKEPHLHVHLQDSSDPYHGVGLPAAFSNLIFGNQKCGSGQITVRTLGKVYSVN